MPNMFNILDEEINDQLPIIDITGDSFRQTVIAQGTPEIYQGHPTTVLSQDGKTIYCVWTYDHGGACGPMAKSTDFGKTWTRLDDTLPHSYAMTHRNCPTLQAITTPDGSERRLCIFSNLNGGLGILMSRDDGNSWYEIPPAKQCCSAMPPTGLMPLKDGSTAIFGQVRNDPKVTTDRATDDQNIWMSISKDGGFSWGDARVVAHKEERNLCEPFALRSPDGSEICLLMRENRHIANSYMCFSSDEGKTWTEPVETPWGLSGDRHEGIQLPDGRFLIAFRDRTPHSSTCGQYMAWVGTYDDIRNNRPGQYRIHLIKHYAGEWDGVRTGNGDTGYSGVELLPDGSIICTTYVHYQPDHNLSSVVCTRFTIEEIDKMAKQLA